MRITLLMLLVCFLASRALAQPATEPGGVNGPTLWLVGDSTVKNGTKGQQGWGDPIKELFDTTKIRIENRARGGRSSRTFLTEGLWAKILEESKPGDFVIIQMGHNDAGPVVDENRNRGTIRGIGDEVQEVTKPDGTTETVHTYGWYLRKYVREAREKGLTPILCSYVPRCPKPDSKMEADPAPGSYRLWAKEIAEQEKVAFIDLYALIWSKYVAMKPEEIKSTYFSEADFTHTNPAGAAMNAAAVVEGIRSLKDVPLATYLK